MIQISKDEAVEMRKRCGDWSVRHTYSHHPTYYLIESPKCLRMLREYRESKLIYSLSEWDLKKDKKKRKRKES